jgi:hypothetical protein
MSDERDLERRVAELEAEVARLKGRGFKRVRYRSALTLGDIPFLAIASGPDPDKGELRGHAKGIIAFGDMATGVVAFGGLARGEALAFFRAYGLEGVCRGGRWR